MANLICRSCAMPLSTVFVDLGLTPISNAFVHPEDAERAEKFYPLDRKSTRLNSSHSQISYAVFCLKKKKNLHRRPPSPPNPLPLLHQRHPSVHTLGLRLVGRYLRLHPSLERRVRPVSTTCLRDDYS